MAKKKKTKRRTRAIITGYLEKVSSLIFDKYREEITEMTRGHQGLYALYRKNKLYYVGLASNLRNRIKHHLKDKHQGKWTHFSLYIIRKTDHTKELESLLLRIAFPEGNKMRGRLRTTNNLLPKLKVQVKQKIKKEYEELFKGHRPAKTKTTKTKMAKGQRPLEDLFPTGKMIYGSYKGQDYKAWVYRNGRIKFNGNIYDTPSEVGKAARKKPTYGWTFWKYKNKKGELVILKALFKGHKTAKTKKSTPGKMTGTTKDNCPLYGTFPTGKIIYGSYKGQDYKAGVYSNGRIKFNGNIYDTPSEAGKAARKRPTNGWWFWSYKNKKGELVRLKELKK